MGAGLSDNSSTIFEPEVQTLLNLRPGARVLRATAIRANGRGTMSSGEGAGEGEMEGNANQLHEMSGTDKTTSTNAKNLLSRIGLSVTVYMHTCSHTP